MASSPRGQQELDFEAEEAAILAAVGESRLDLVVEDTGDPEQLAPPAGGAGRDAGGASVLPRANNWPARPGEPGVPVLMMEDEVGGGRPTTAGDLVGLLTAGAAAAVRVGVPDRDRGGRVRSPAAGRRPQGRARPGGRRRSGGAFAGDGAGGGGDAGGDRLGRVGR